MLGSLTLFSICDIFSIELVETPVRGFHMPRLFGAKRRMLSADNVPVVLHRYLSLTV